MHECAGQVSNLALIRFNVSVSIWNTRKRCDNIFNFKKDVLKICPNVYLIRFILKAKLSTFFFFFLS